MNIINKHLFMGLLLLILSPAVMAAPDSRERFVTGYTNCSIKLLDDDSVEVSFRANLVGKPFEKDEYTRQSTLSLGLHDWNDSSFPYTSQDISKLSIGGASSISPLNGPGGKWEFDFKPGTMFYNVSFTIPSDTIHRIGVVKIAAAIGLDEIYYDNGRKYQHTAISPKFVSFNSSGECKNSDTPDALKISPDFKLKSAVWELKPIDLDTLLDKSRIHLNAPLKDPEANRLCISYRGMGRTDDGYYTISVDNINGLSANDQHFKLIEKSSNSEINYDIFLTSDDLGIKDIRLPNNQGDLIQLDKFFPRKEICWSPRIWVYSTDTTDKGSYSDTLNFTITPEA
ncbi:alpha-related fimbriae major subunit [Yersinia bercovieri]|uniref:hypothetical protein n=1 Tax=Yersinia bercovieri TaxID=634 RepID=UPI00061CBC86|nr:hypothetical protein [Yersinia bercovieri]CNF64088.1 alpha-related fimbriae major subunit [Yersinia bercovieri]